MSGRTNCRLRWPLYRKRRWISLFKFNLHEIPNWIPYILANSPRKEPECIQPFFSFNVAQFLYFNGIFYFGILFFALLSFALPLFLCCCWCMQTVSDCVLWKVCRFFCGSINYCWISWSHVDYGDNSQMHDKILTNKLKCDNDYKKREAAVYFTIFDMFDLTQDSLAASYHRFFPFLPLPLLCPLPLIVDVVSTGCRYLFDLLPFSQMYAASCPLTYLLQILSPISRY